MDHLKKEALFKKIFLVSDWAEIVQSVLAALSGFLFTLSALLFVCLVIFDFGFRKTVVDENIVYQTYLLLLSMLFTTKLFMELLKFRRAKWFAVVFRMLVLFAAFLTLLVHADIMPAFLSGLNDIFGGKQAILFGSLMLIITQMHHITRYLNRMNVSASFLFAGSFALIILVGSGLLMLPNATVQPISYLEALFTATSAVCVTGLTVVDTQLFFSPMGKGVILVLIQIGGLGIMTFTGFFSYLFLGSASLKDRFTLKDFFSGEQLEGLYKVLLKILLFTILIESAGAVLIYHLLDGDWIHKMHSAVFHAISAFCNAGFSIYSHGLNEPQLRHNDVLQMVICGLVILGGIGFPVLLHLYKSMKSKTKYWIHFFAGRKISHEVLTLAVSERLALNTTLVLLIAGSVLYYVFETGAFLSSDFSWHQGIKAIAASVYARTAGFNMASLSEWSYPTLFLTMFLMWVGASPGSTGGGIKTTTLALALRSSVNFLRGKRRLEIGNREIGSSTIIRVLSIIVLSLFFILSAFMLLMIFEPARHPAHLLFECISAFSTTGLSIADTATLGTPSRVVVLILMFVGRIGPVVLLSGLLLTKTSDLYRLPVEEIKIN
ncbi:MAG: potassium transporter TrkG [Smithella sp.]|jgi:Trk-type K+ transport system membrane component|nr:potassium transporter TrkG [Smithellaceae bacterium]